jgi:transcription elongation factor Elf1
MKIAKIQKKTVWAFTCPHCQHLETVNFDPCRITPYREGRKVVCWSCDTGYMISPTGTVPDQSGLVI